MQGSSFGTGMGTMNSSSFSGFNSNSVSGISGRSAPVTPTFAPPINGIRPQALGTGGQPDHSGGRTPSPLPPRPNPLGTYQTAPPSLPASRFANSTSTPPLQRTIYNAPSPANRAPMPPSSSTGGATSHSAAKGIISQSAGGSANRKKRPTGAMSAAPPVRAAEAIPAAKRKKKKGLDTQLPERVAALVPESTIYNELLRLEARVDSTMARKKLDVQEALRCPPRTPRVLRIYVFNTYSNQPRGEEAVDPLEPPSWTLRIQGRLLDEGASSQAPPISEAAAHQDLLPTRKKDQPLFSSFVKKLKVQLDPLIYPTNHTVEWEGVRAASHMEGFEIKRQGSQEVQATVSLEIDYRPERFQLSTALAEVVGVELDTRPRVITALWHYIKGRKLQDAQDPSIINCDAALKAVLGEERIKFSSVSSRLQSHLSAPKPVVLQHRICVAGLLLGSKLCYDVAVDVPALLERDMASFLAKTERHADISMMDEQIRMAVARISNHRRRRAFFLGFSHSPVDFVHSLVASQSRDLRQMAGEGGRNIENERRSGFYSQPWVEDAVVRYLNRKLLSGAEGA